MKHFRLSFLLLLLLPLTFVSCNKEEVGGQAIEVSGTLQRQTGTISAYGTHTLSTATTYYALQSSRVGMDPYIGRQVTVTGNVVTDSAGGPPLINVETIR